MAEAQTVDQNIDVLLGMLNDPEIQTATITVLSKMPTMAKMFTVLEMGTDLIEPMVKDPELLDNAFSSMKALAKPGMAGALMTLADKLPTAVKLLSVAELGVDLVEPMIKDEEFIDLAFSTAQKLAEPFSEEKLKAALTLLDKLPMLVKLTNWLEIGVDLVEPMMTDQELLPLFIKTVFDATLPVGQLFNEYYGVFKEAKSKADKDSTNYGVFGLMRFLKDPTVQKSLRIAAAFLSELAAKEAKLSKK